MKISAWAVLSGGADHQPLAQHRASQNTGQPWRTRLNCGALLTQIGEFSFVLASVRLQAGMMMGYVYQMTIAVIAINLLLSPGDIALLKRHREPDLQDDDQAQRAQRNAE